MKSIYQFFNKKPNQNLLKLFQKDLTITLFEAKKTTEGELVIVLKNCDEKHYERLEKVVSNFFNALWGSNGVGNVKMECSDNEGKLVTNKSFHRCSDNDGTQQIMFDRVNQQMIISGNSLVTQFEKFIAAVLEQQRNQGNLEDIARKVCEAGYPTVLARMIAEYAVEDVRDMQVNF